MGVVYFNSSITNVELTGVAWPNKPYHSNVELTGVAWPNSIIGMILLKSKLKERI